MNTILLFTGINYHSWLKLHKYANIHSIHLNLINQCYTYYACRNDLPQILLGNNSNHYHYHNGDGNGNASLNVPTTSSTTTTTTTKSTFNNAEEYEMSTTTPEYQRWYNTVQTNYATPDIQSILDVLRKKEHNYTAIVTSGGIPVTAEMMELCAPNLKLVSTMSVGFNHIDLDYCRKHHIAVANTPDVVSETTADLCVGLMLATARRFREANAAVHDGTWGRWKPTFMLGRDLHHSTVGIVGLGRIGLEVARRLSGFRCKILYSGNSIKPEAEKIGAKFVSFDELIEKSDFVVPQCPLNDSTRHMFNANVFKRMKKTAIFINTTRGAIVDQDALVDALKNGEIAGAGLDVTDPEPLPPTHPLAQFPNCYILPHIGSASEACRAEMALLTIDNLIHYENGNHDQVKFVLKN
jgi:lactate dehydrogenase-like 2-hydroxyacid dehydrogenase